MKILFLHLSDLHIKNESDISDYHLIKMVKSLKVYKGIEIKYVILVISGDLTFSGEKTQFINISKMLGTIIKKLKNLYNDLCYYILPVPGNHDVMHNCNILSMTKIKRHEYSSIEVVEHSKLEQFYVFSKYNKCFSNKEVYCDKKIIDLNGFKIQVNLINNAIYSTCEKDAVYKGLLYIPSDRIEELADSSAADFVITIMHHSPDFYRDDIKNMIEERVISNSSILFYGHEHHNVYRRTSYNGTNTVIIQSGGCLINNGSWDSSSYRVGILDTETKMYTYHKFIWNKVSKQYEHDVMSTELVMRPETTLPILKSFIVACKSCPCWPLFTE